MKDEADPSKEVSEEKGLQLRTKARKRSPVLLHTVAIEQAASQTLPTTRTLQSDLHADDTSSCSSHPSGVLGWIHWGRSHPLRLYLLLIAAVTLFLPLLLVQSVWATTELGRPEALTCDSSLWAGGLACGLDGIDCTPFISDVWSPMRCPPYCGALVRKQSDNKLVGSAPHFRATSPLCLAALERGLYKDGFGGCFAVRPNGMPSEGYYTGSCSAIPGIAKEICSTAFESWFPRSFAVEAIASRHCGSIQWALFPLMMFFLWLLVFLHPQRLTLYMSLVVAGYFYVSFIAGLWDITHNYALEWTKACYNLWITIALGYLMHLTAPQGLPSCGPTDSCLLVYVLYVVPTVLALHLDFVPIMGLPEFNLDANIFSGTASAIFAIIVLVIVFGFVCYFLYHLHKEKLLRRYLLLYAAIILVIVVIYALASPVFTPHIHHNQFAFLLFPLTCFSTPMGYFCQGLMLGLFVNGMGRYDWSTPFVYGPGFYPPFAYDKPAYFNVTNQTDTSLTVEFQTPFPDIQRNATSPNPVYQDPPWLLGDNQALGYYLLLNEVVIVQTLWNETVSTQQASNLTYTVTGLSPNTTYFFKLAFFYYQSWVGSFSDEIDGTTLASNTPDPISQPNNNQSQPDLDSNPTSQFEPNQAQDLMILTNYSKQIFQSKRSQATASDSGSPRPFRTSQEEF
eukprot:g32242.t1